MVVCGCSTRCRLKRGDYPKRKTAQPEDVFLTKTASNVIVIHC